MRSGQRVEREHNPEGDGGVRVDDALKTEYCAKNLTVWNYRGQIMADSAYLLSILFASHILKKGFHRFLKSCLLSPFEGKHSQDIHELSPDKAPTHSGRIHQISVTKVWLLPISVIFPDMEHDLLLSAMASGISVSGLPGLLVTSEL